ncbi:pseudouridine synthase [Algoriphagus boritolerans]|uniref:Pseudouridine synthase n=1 Tax=Algoriphagus boritolerans DSM 17298 = JCM 18970 TaxID=1120964 RepID=A0A1H5STW7_9BACT|nr:pseudouridine synthase [Algoriphagus boritolerans]SEF53408.1 23S rRNA pseudouridine2605 synthase [Algoriphagus boritolerans DSM 17298 = JCM 18970]
MLHTMKKNNSRKPFFNDERKDSGAPRSSGKSDFSSSGSRFDKGEGEFSSKGKFFGKKEDSYSKPSYGKRDDSKPSYGKRDDSFSKPSYGKRDDSKPSYGKKEDSYGKKSFGKKPDYKSSFGDKPKGRFFNSEEKSGEKSSYGKSYGAGDSERKSFGEKRFDKGEGFKKKFEKKDGADYPKKSFGDKPGRFKKEGFTGKKFEKRDQSDSPKKTYGDKLDRFPKRDSDSKDFGNESKPRTEKPFFKKDFSEDQTPKEHGERLVYKGRGRDQKPVFAPEKPKFNEEKPAEKRGFGKNRPNRQELDIERPDYNFDALPARKVKGKEETDSLRLNKYISNSGICGRREADDLIAKGLISVNGQVITEMGYKVKKSDRVIYQGKKINPEKPVYLLLNKPKDFITTTDDPMERKTVMNLVGNACEERIFPVGRLDRNTTGLLLFTNDGELTAKLSHPSNEVKKIYQVTLDKPLTQNHELEIRAGLTLEDGDVTVDDMQVLSLDRTILGLEIHIGRNRIVRRLFAHLGYEVTALDRVIYAGLDKKDLKRGHYRFLTEQEVIRLKFFT